MPQSLSKVYVHLVFSTKNREDFIDENIEKRLFEYIGGICKNLDCPPLQIGGYKNHIHALCLLSRKITQMKFVEEVKRKSSKWMKRQGKEYQGFYWQAGYGIFSINPKQTAVVIKYIKNQKQHHQRQTFQDELRSFFKNYHIEYDECYVWD